MSSSRPGRVFLISLVLMAVPLIPLWAVGPSAARFGWDSRAADIGAGILAAMLFVGVAGIAWELIRRAQDDAD